MSKLTLVRHGQASFLAADYDQLSPLGEQQSRLLGEYWADHDITFDRAVTGPRKRHRQTVEQVAAAYADRGKPFPEIEEQQGLDEFAWSELMAYAHGTLAETDEHIASLQQAFANAPDPGERGRTIQHLVEAVTERWINGATDDAGIESFVDFQERVHASIEAITADTPGSARVVAFTSGGPAAVSVQRALHTSPERTLALIWTLRNGGLVEFLYSRSRYSLSCFNEAPHLRDPELWTFR